MISLALLAAAVPTTPAGWRAAALADADAFHQGIITNHPGAVNRLDPDFPRREAAAYRLLRRRAARVADLAGYRAAIRGYVANFDDGHVQSWLDKKVTVADARWPGFLTGFDGTGGQRVMTRLADAPVPLGARLDECDGVPAATLAARNVGAFVGRWSMASMRAESGGLVLVDRGNPFVRRPAICTFTVDGARRTVRLRWRSIADRSLTDRLRATSGVAGQPIAARTLTDGTRWYGLSDFDGDPAGPTGRKLDALIAAMRVDRAALATAPAIVLDLRGNGGGSSDWSVPIAKVLWGEAPVATVLAEDDGSYVEWRVSPAIIGELDAYRQRYMKAPGVDPALLTYFHVIDLGLRSALTRHQPLWRETPDAQAGFTKPSAATGAPSPLTGPVYLLTDAGCASACLDAVDLWRRLGGIQVGRETSGDTLYMDVHEDLLPSGLTHIGIPMKVYRGRRRGSNETWKPVHLFTGDITDTPSLERWIEHLPRAN